MSIFYVNIIDNLEDIRSIFPKLTDEMKKGDCGRVGVIGGSAQYTGAPYFASIAVIRIVYFFLL